MINDQEFLERLIRWGHPHHETVEEWQMRLARLDRDDFDRLYTDLGGEG